MAIFSDVASACTSTNTIWAPASCRAAISREAVVKGSSMLARNTRPMTFTTPTFTPLAAVARNVPRPGVPAG